MRITKEIISAIEETAMRCGGMVGIFRLSGVKESTLSKVVNQKQDRVDDDTWDALFEVIKHSLPKGKDGIPLPEYRPDSWWQQNREWPPSGPGIMRVVAQSRNMCRIYGMANCATGAILWGDVAPDGEDHLEQVPIPDTIKCKGRVSAFRAINTSMEPTINDGDLLFFSPDVELSNNNIALIKYDDDKVVCKRWTRDGDTVVLTSDAPGITPIILSGKRIEWAYRVLAVTRTREL